MEADARPAAAEAKQLSLNPNLPSPKLERLAHGRGRTRPFVVIDLPDQASASSLAGEPEATHPPGAPHGRFPWFCVPASCDPRQG